jgi:hypothetical protein
MKTLYQQFFGEEALRYAAECRRLGRLSRHARPTTKSRLMAKPRREEADWLSFLFGPPRKFAHRRISR